MARAKIEIINALGLHARASARLTQLANRFKSEIWMENGTRRINAKSIMGVMMLAAKKGAHVTVEAVGADEDEAVESLVALIASKFGEEE
ncbi:MAG: HPr family phosphocarrier protein [Candidatus Accumulibacter sp.]|jgi:phosphocarrier protein|nr:HPr family phosphocarrier protein [Accumulibacter sp.]